MGTVPDAEIALAWDDQSSASARLWPDLSQPASRRHLRNLCGMRTAVLSALEEPWASGEIERNATGYQLKTPFPVSRPVDPQGNGNGKHSLCPSGG